MALIRLTLELLRKEGGHSLDDDQGPLLKVCISLSLRNADKKALTSEELSRRFAYMEAFRRDAQALDKSDGHKGNPHQYCTAIFEEAPLFVTKHGLLRRTLPTVRLIHWIMGDDTFIRLLDPKYYETGGRGLEEAMAILFTGTRLFVFLRTQASPADVWSELERRQFGRLSPSQRERVQFCSINDAKLRDASSTKCRELLGRAKYEALKELLSPQVHALFTNQADPVVIDEESRKLMHSRMT